MKILFQGDGSSDDPGRLCPGQPGEETADRRYLGEGYPKYAAVMFTDAYPDTDFTFYRGDTDGDEPDVICVLPDFCAPVPDEEYEAALVGELTRLRRFPRAKILVLEPFLATEEVSERRDRVDDRINATRRASAGNADILVPLDGLFAAERIAHPDIDYADENGLTPEGLCFLGECCFRAAMPVIDSFAETDDDT